jgi:hypothetical protein
MLLIIVVFGVLSACDEQPAQRPTATSSSVPTATRQPVTPSATTAPATNTPLPLPPTVTSVPEPATATPLPVTATATPAPSPTPEPIVLRSAADFEGRSRLTGEVIDNPEVLNRRPIMCKISNHPAEWVRPQSGLNSADLIIEEPIEGVFTRFVGIFQSQAPERIGPIRSGRLIDIDLVAMYDGALCFSGAAIGVSRLINRSVIAPAALRSWYTGYYRTGEDKPYEHTFYADPLGLWEALTSVGENRAAENTSQTPFSSLPPDGGEPLTAITLNYDDWILIEWRWDAESALYRRWADGEPTTDALDGQQLAVKNVVVVTAFSGLRTGICVTDTECHEMAFETRIEGRGAALVLRDGQLYRGEWVREQTHDMFTFVDNSGASIPLQIGRTWIQIVPHYFENPITLGSPGS